MLKFLLEDKFNVETINVNNPFKGKMEKLIEYFVQIYGEKYRYLITSRLNNAEFLFFDQNGHNRINAIEIKYQIEISKLLEEFKKDAQALISFPISNNYKFPLSIEQLENLEEWSTHINKDELFNVANFFRIIINSPKSKINYTQQEEAFIEVLNDEGKSQTITDLLSKFNEIYQQKYKNKLNNLLKEKNSFLETPIKQRTQIEALEQHFYDGLDDFFVKYFNTAFKTEKTKEEMSPILDNSPVLVDFLLKKADFFNAYDRKEYFSLFKKFEKIFNLKIHKSLGEFFSDENFMKILGSGELKFEIKTEKLDLDRKKSMILSEFYENYDKLLHFDMYFRDEFVGIIKNFTDSSNADGFIFTSYFPNKNAFKTICVLNTYFGLSSSTAVHELNHIIESSAKIENGKFVTKCGFDRVTTDITNLTPENYTNGDFKTTEVEYRFVNEIVNDFLAMKVLDAMKKDNFILGDAENLPSRYSIVFPFVQDFIQDNMQDIVQVRFDNNFDKVVKMFGKENLDLLEDGIYKMLHINRNSELRNNFRIALQVVQTQLKNLGINPTDTNAIKKLDTDKLSLITKNYVEAIKIITSATENITKYMREKDTNNEKTI